MTNEHADSLQLAWLADRFRAQATLGLHYRPDRFDRERFERLRRHAAELASLVDRRDVDVIEEHFKEDRGIHTPKAAAALHVDCADGSRLWRTFHLDPRTLLPEALSAAAYRLVAAEPGRPHALTDSHALGLPDPHSHLAIYRLTSSLSRIEIQGSWPAPDTAMQHRLTGVSPAAVPGPPVRGNGLPMSVSPVAAAICREVTALAAEGAAETADKYNIERFEHLKRLASNISINPVKYQRFAFSGDHEAAAATGAELAILDGDGGVLLIQRSDTGQWAMPGGACEVGESWSGTAAREAFEEIGVDIAPEKLRLVDVFDNRAISTERTTIPVIAVFSTRLRPEQVAVTPNHEVSSTAWVSAAELKELNLFPGHRTKAKAALES
ncbi:NUDIX hydrolase N-terminal domain-containing protein [Glycomyces dulcitolivorans]|uniref:NUDIX hydrolase N-terminal domain-containing protein n=1 Tax=Glycomyces dulcitolivorans TaxID=2200759 RepID=UPI0018E54074|nr:NUDIX hydrolase N-terminal domain-containing protein [Glycomyces dulcitolivorans]